MIEFDRRRFNSPLVALGLARATGRNGLLPSPWHPAGAVRLLGFPISIKVVSE
jgi:hypothetical protein